MAAIVWGAERFAENLARAATRLGVSTFALALLLAGAEPEELATAVAATVREAPAIAFGDVVGANVTICLVALGVGALVAPLPFGRRVLRYGLLGLPAGIIAVTFVWDGKVGRLEGAALVAAGQGLAVASHVDAETATEVVVVGSFVLEGGDPGLEPLGVQGIADAELPLLCLDPVDRPVPELAGLDVPFLAVGLDPRGLILPPVGAVRVGGEGAEEFDDMVWLALDCGVAELLAAYVDLFGELRR